MASHLQQKLRFNDFENAKAQCLGKRDKSSAGRIDPRAVDICAVLNEREDCYTTSSCAGRSFMYRGPGRKSTTRFRRFRISHEMISDPMRYFDLGTIDTDPSGGGDPIPTIGQYDYKDNGQRSSETVNGDVDNDVENDVDQPKEQNVDDDAQHDADENDQTIWLRYEPFILHVACRSLAAASALMAAARPAFKNVGLTTWKNDRTYLVAVWGDEGLEMPMCTRWGSPLYSYGVNKSNAEKQGGTNEGAGLNEVNEQNAQMLQWLMQLVNERHERNWEKINRFVESVRAMGPPVDVAQHGQDEGDALDLIGSIDGGDNVTRQRMMPKSFDVIGDVAYLHSLPDGDDSSHTPEEMGKAMMKKNKAIKVVVVRESNMEGSERAPGLLRILAGAQRSPLITTHTEYGIKCVVDLERTFFTPRMGPERLRICQQVARGERVLVLFAGVAMDALQIAGRTEASAVIAVELNEVAVRCAHLAHAMLKRNKAVKCAGASERLIILQGDVMDIVPSFPKDQSNLFHRILAPRPKEGATDGDLGMGDGGSSFLDVFLPYLTPNGGECHWYDFVADHEFPSCERTTSLLSGMCNKHGLKMTVLHVANVGSIAKRQLRVCIDLKVSPI